jgi:Tetratricopeptide repeat
LIHCRKTQIALAYAYWLRDTYPEVSVFWVHASTAEQVRQAYKVIAEECHVPGYSDPKTDMLPLVKAWLEKKDRGRWLMVIDNADDTQVFFGSPHQLEKDGTPAQAANLARYLPECPHGSILVTSRNKQAGSRLTQGNRAIEVSKMDEDESDQLLRAKLEEVDVTSGELSLLSSRLEYLPLALVQAAAFIQENTMEVNEYLHLLDKSDQNLVELLGEFETVGRDSGTPRAVTETWILSFEQILRQNAFASELLSLMSFFDKQAIPQAFLLHYSERASREDETQLVGINRGSDIQYQKALGILKAFSFVSEGKDHNLDMHRLVQLVTRKWLFSNGTMGQFAAQALLTVSDLYPYGHYENRIICGQYLPHVYAVLKYEGTGLRDEKVARAGLLHSAAGYLLYQGQWRDAERLQLEAVRLAMVVLGEEHPNTLTSMGDLALTYGNQGRWKEAESLGVRVMEMRKRVLGEEHPDTLTSMGNLASTFWNQGRWKEAESLEVQVMEIRKRVLGEEHPNTLTSMANLALMYENQGRLKEAESLEVQVMETRKRVLGEEHPSTLTIMNNLSFIWEAQGRQEEAVALMNRCLQLRGRVLGPDHPDTVSTRLAMDKWTAARDQTH